MTAALLFGLLAGAANAQDPPAQLPDPKVVPIQVTGPPAQRLNFIIMGDGYQKDQQEIFRRDLDRNLAVMWATEPFRTYRNYINVYAVELASIDYGVRCDPDGRVRAADGTVRDTGVREGPIDGKRTALRMIFQNGCADPLSRGTVYGGAPLNCAADAPYYPAGVNPCETGNQAHNRIIDTYVAPVLGIPRTSQNLQTLAIFNTFTYGGIGGSQATTSGGSPQGPLISLHEIGHSLGTLADEYPYSSRDVVRPCYTGAEPSSFHHTILTAAEMLTRQTKWWRWIGEESLSGGKIGTYEGGGTYPCGQKRPSLALDDALDRLRLRPDRPRAHGRPRHRHAQLRPDERAEHRRGHRRQGPGPVGGAGQPALPRRHRHLAQRRRDRSGDRHRPQPGPGAAEPAGRDRRVRRGP